MGVKSTGSHPNTTKADGHLLEYFRQNFGAGGGAATAIPPSGLTATGGVISDYTDPGSGTIYRSHVFTSSGTFTVSQAAVAIPNNVEYLVVAGGGGGGGNVGGGGGAGGYRTGETQVTGTGTSFNVNIGNGGTRNVNNLPTGNGGDSYISFPSGTERAHGGGHGAKYNGWTAREGGSGGGGAYGVTGGANGNTPPYSPPQGNPGGDGRSVGDQQGGGGGGAGGAGYPWSSGHHGGEGLQLPEKFRAPTFEPLLAQGPNGEGFWVAGGGGGGTLGNPIGSNGKGGGPGGPYAGGGNASRGGAADNGQANTGGGGGGVGAADGSNGGNGGTGVVLIVYPGR